MAVAVSAAAASPLAMPALRIARMLSSCCWSIHGCGLVLAHASRAVMHVFVWAGASALATNVHRIGHAALGFGRPQRCWRSLRMRARLELAWLPDTPPPATAVPTTLRLGPHQADISAFHVRKVPLASLGAGSGASRVRYRTLNPVKYRHHGRDYPLPDPYLTYSGLLRRYLALAPELPGNSTPTASANCPAASWCTGTTSAARASPGTDGAARASSAGSSSDSRTIADRSPGACSPRSTTSPQSPASATAPPTASVP